MASFYRANEVKFTEDAYVNIAVCIFFNSVFLFEYIKIGLILLFGLQFGLTSGLMVLFLVNVKHGVAEKERADAGQT